MKKMYIQSKKYSLKKLLMYFFALFVVILLSGFILLSIYLTNSANSFVRDHHKDLLMGYVNTLDSWIENLNSFNLNIASTNYDFQSLNKEGKIEQKLLHENNLRNMLAYRTCPTGAIFIYDMNGSTELYRFGADYSTKDFLNNVQLKRKLLDYCKNMSLDEYYKWITVEIDNSTYLLQVFKYDNLNVCSMIDLERASNYINTTNQDVGIYFAFAKDQKFISDLGSLSKARDDDKLWTRDKINLIGNTLVVTKETLENTKVELCIIEKISLLNNYSRIALVFLVLAFSALLVIVFSLFHTMSRYLFYPLYQIGTASELLMQANGEKSEAVFEEKEKKAIGKNFLQIEEVEQINLALFDLMQKKVRLEKENIRRQKEEEHAQLQYYQLQTRSHFFLNCLKSLYGMLEAGQYNRMQRMIIAFSNHIRYIFHDNMMEVSLGQEMTEVNDYYNIIAMDREKPIILIQNIEEDLLDIMVPPLVVQTFIENSMKYSATKEKVLQVVVAAEKQKQDEKKLLKLKITDNGKGFSYENLEKLNSEEDYSYEQYHVGINNLKRRLQLIYGRNYSIHFYNDLNGGACVIIYIPVEIEKR